jgi:GTP-binding protein
MFVDELTIKAYAGRGGNGVVRWRHLKGKEFSGPSGGDGGRGGDVYLRCVFDIARLGKYRHHKVFKAGNGGGGESESRHGKAGEDCVIDVPRGSVVRPHGSDALYELLKVGEQVLILKGGAGGFGNEHFKGSLNRSPQEATEGKKGESDTFDIELRLVVDAGIIGLPNAGKSSLLNALTRASSRVGNYAFTTLEPMLGVFEEYVLADIPGLIEGASKGKGLGHAFLRHITRTRLLLHCISLEGETDIEAQYGTIRRELEAHGDTVLDKLEMIVLTKADEAHDARIAEATKALEKFGKEVLVVSVIDDERLTVFRDRLREFLKRES